MTEEIIYILTNPVIPDLVKIGRTENLQARIRQLSAHSGVPVPFEVYYACTVSDAVTVEQRVHDGFGDHRVNPRREFFRINPERVIAILQMVALSEITPINDDFIEDPDEKSSLNRERIRRARFTFSSVVIPIGSTLYFSRNSNNTVKVVDDRRVEFEGQITSLSDATLTLLQRDYGWNANAVQGTNFWEFENETLRDRRLRLEEED